MMHLSDDLDQQRTNEGLSWKSLVREEGGSPLKALLEHQNLIEQKEAEILAKAEALRSRETEVEQAKVESSESGYQEGFQKGYEEGLQKAANEATLLADITERLNQELAGLQDRLGDKVMQVIMTACRQVVQDHSTNCPESVAELVKAAINNISADVVYVTVAASPFTIKQLEHHINASTVLSTQVRQSVAVSFREDPRLADGGFMIFHTAGQVDYSLETRWKNVFSALSGNPADLQYQPQRPQE